MAKLKAKPRKTQHCYDAAGNFLFDLQVSEPLIPKAAIINNLGKNWACVGKDPITISEEDGVSIMEYNAILVEIDALTILDSGNIMKSKIWGPDAVKLAQSRDRLKKIGVDTDNLEELGVDHTNLTNEEALEMAEQISATVEVPPSPEALKAEIDAKDVEITDHKNKIDQLNAELETVKADVAALQS